MKGEDVGFNKIIRSLHGLLNQLLLLRDVTDTFDGEEIQSPPDVNGVTYTEEVVNKSVEKLQGVYDALRDTKDSVIDFNSSSDAYQVYNRTLDLVSADCDPIVSLQEFYSNLCDTTAYAVGQKQAFLLAHEKLRKSGINMEEYDSKRPVIPASADGEGEEVEDVEEQSSDNNDDNNNEA